MFTSSRCKDNNIAFFYFTSNLNIPTNKYCSIEIIGMLNRRSNLSYELIANIIRIYTYIDIYIYMCLLYCKVNSWL